MEISELNQLGLNKNQAKVYLAALEFGPATIAHLAHKSGVQRSTIYEFLQEMLDRELLIKSISGKRQLYNAVPPEELFKLLEKQKQTLNRLMPELLSLGEKNLEKPRFRVYEGIAGLKTALNDTLNQPEGSEILYFASYAEASKVLSPSFLKLYLNKRVEKGIIAKGIIPSEKEFKPYQQANAKELRESITIPQKDFPMKNEILIYGNRVAILAYGQEKVALIIESNQIADSQRAIFNLLWKNLAK